LYAIVTSAVLTTNIGDDRIIFDTITIGYHQDTVLMLRNDGDIPCVMTRFELSGAYAADFSMDVKAPFTLEPGETKLVNIRFAPLAVGQRYAVINMSLNDPVRPNPRIVLQGWGISESIAPTISFGNGSDEWDFGPVPIRETRTKDLVISNAASKYSTLRIDNMEIEHIDKQPFSFGDLEFPLYIPAGDSISITLSFTPNDKVRYYSAFLNIFYSDSITLTTDPKDTLAAFLRGAVIFPNMDTDFTPVLIFGPVEQEQLLTKEFKLTNNGSIYLRIDSILVVGKDAAEFNVHESDLPAIVDVYHEYIGSVTFKPGLLGSKDAKLLIFNTDFFGNNSYADDILEVAIWAEGVPFTNNTSGVTKLDEIPDVYGLSQNYPNPFNPTTKIEYSLPEPSSVRLSIYNNLGQEVINLVNEYQSAGIYRVDFNANNLPSGIYFYRIQSDKFTAVRKMMLVK